MRIFMYVMILAVVAMLYKTFYWDYQPKEVPSEVNTSIETPVVSEAQAVPVQTVETPKDNTADEQNRTGWQSRKGMPIDRLGDSIGNSLKSKIKVN
ncbi:MAG TPA: hypothetical protein PLM93_00510 [Sulfuricurvum sp.]|nr:MAG: hypothetical protein B7Y30_04300 [Campylobacterales bacterium 16-40-21]OZA03829.1 MAG: hypothetical protein B7X89_03925 [Sulfuricurvum sp. 17-40-25]HQS65652.1 hypothetical protein [Sulfuricurvum sp.]HQT36158.1 hypothetical protein [Sulfuricurvum sp.]